MSSPLALTLELPAEQIDVVARRVIDLLKEEKEDGFYDVDGAAAFLKTTRRGIYHLVERGKLKAHRGTGRLLFTRADLKAAARV
jgi:excisionase family DNA binding protein